MTGVEKRVLGFQGQQTLQKVNVLGKLMEHMGYLSRSMLVHVLSSLWPKNFLEREDLWFSSFLDLSFFILMREAPGRLFPTCIDSHLPLAQNSLYTQVTYSGTLQLPLQTELIKGRTLSLFC